jgi:signal transduction histidine kinase
LLKHVLTPLRLLAVVSGAGALVVLVGAALAAPSDWLVLALAALALALIGMVSYRIARRAIAAFADSQAWAEVASLRAALAQREALWAALPAPVAVWDAQNGRLMASTAWKALGLAADTPPNDHEVSVGDPPRTFVAEACALPDGGRLFLLREVTREREALRAKDELLAIIGHELRTPLSSIKGYGQLMARQLATVQEQVQRLDQLAGDMLDTARADGGRLTLRRERVPLADLVRAAAERFRAANPSRTLELQVDSSISVEGDEARLGQVLDNLLSNAAKYSPADRPITLRARQDGDWIRLEVVDRGAGIAPEHLPRLFDRFYRVPAQNAAGAPAGVGLGLSIVHDLVEAHGGRVEVASDGPGTGCTFTVSLPAA